MLSWGSAPTVEVRTPIPQLPLRIVHIDLCPQKKGGYLIIHLLRGPCVDGERSASTGKGGTRWGGLPARASDLVWISVHGALPAGGPPVTLGQERVRTEFCLDLFDICNYAYMCVGVVLCCGWYTWSPRVITGGLTVTLVNVRCGGCV